MKKVLNFTYLFVLFMFASHCASRNPDQIYIDSPEVFTRERLINERLREKEWLEKKLGETFLQSYQGLQDTRSFSGLIAQLQMLVEPLSGQQIKQALAADKETEARDKALKDIEFQNNISQLERHEEIDALKHRLDILILEKKIAEIGNMETVKKEDLPVSTSPVKLESVTSKAASLVEEFKNEELRAANISELKNDRFPEYAKPESLAQTKAELASLDKLQDEKAYRDQIKAMLRETDMEDVHESYGNTIYTLKYDVSINSSRRFNDKHGEYGRVALKLEDTNITIDNYFELYQRWIRHLENKIRTDMQLILDKFKSGKFSNEERIDLNSSLKSEIAKLNSQVNIKEDHKNIRDVLTRMEKSLAENNKIELGIFDNNAIFGAIYYLAIRNYRDFENRYILFYSFDNSWESIIYQPEFKKYPKFESNLLDGIVTKSMEYSNRNINIYKNIEAKDKDNEYYDRYFNCFEEFVRTLNKIGKTNIYINYTEPKEYAQNISQVSANEKMFNLIVSLKAVLATQGTKVNSNLDYINKRQELLQAILRKPLVVGYSQGKKEFGWILGPRFQIDNTKPSFAFSPVQYSLQAAIVIPGWYDSISIKKEAFWGEKPDALQSTDTVVLVPDLSTITIALLNRTTGYRKPPLILPQKYILQARSKGQILIRGDYLWKSPEVFIGAQKATGIKVMSDMKGLQATFEEVIMPAIDGPPRTEASVDLVVVTSDGATTLPDAVNILADKKAETAPKTLEGKIVSTWAIKNGSIKIALPTKILPDKNSIKIYVKNKNSEIWQKVRGKMETSYGEEYTIIDVGSIDDLGQSGKKVGLVELINLIDNSCQNMALKGEFAYFIKKEDGNLRLLSQSIPCNKRKLEDKSSYDYYLNGDMVFQFKNPELFLGAYPDLEKSLKDKIILCLTTENVPASAELPIPGGFIYYKKNASIGEIKIIAENLSSSKLPGVKWLVDRVEEAPQNKLQFKLMIKTMNGSTIEVFEKMTLCMNCLK